MCVAFDDPAYYIYCDFNESLKIIMCDILFFEIRIV